MSTNPTYNYRQPPPADYVDPEGRVSSTGVPDVVVHYAFGRTAIFSAGYARSEWHRGQWDWWSPIPPTPPVPPKPQRRYIVTKWERRWNVRDTRRDIDVAMQCDTLDIAAFLADALEGREA